MKKRWFCYVGLFVLAGILLLSTACAARETASAPATEAAPAHRPVVDKPTWEAKWDEVTREAKKEGVVSVIAASSVVEEREILTRILKDKFGVTFELSIVPDVLFIPKVNLERQAGIYDVDVVIKGPEPFAEIKKNRLIEPLDNVIILPEVVDKKNWRSPEGVFYDKDHMIIGGFSTPSSRIAINTKLVSPREIKGWADILNPKWKGKIVMADPTVSEGGLTAVTMLLIMGEDYLRKLAQQDPVLIRDKRLLVEWVVREKFPIGIGAKESALQNFSEAGAGELLYVVDPVEGTTAGSGGRQMGLMNRAPHPNAARVFLNWTQTREAQTILARARGDASRRLDVSNDWLTGHSMIKPGMNLIEVTEEITELLNTQYFDLFKKIFAVR
ncbi:MAG: extracellular solute-binding protein [Chloroflexi bacterium]|nr:extracellular solute-binding protein [Chloroflexota bacterium]